ncbi:MAG: NUDIX domain-containing protein [bacterium]|nr:NUDIX domain-containing protein [bacterium]
MHPITIIRDADIGSLTPPPNAYRERESARAVVFNDDGKIAILFASKKNYHKLPGGGVEEGEDLNAALVRELREEIGCAIKNPREFAMIEEYRNKQTLHHIAHCFLAELEGEVGTTRMDESEIADGFTTEWMNLSDAIAKIAGETAIESYEGKFIRLRELAFLKEAAHIIA